MRILISVVAFCAVSFTSVLLSFDDSAVRSEFSQCKSAKRLNEIIRKHISIRTNEELDSLIASANKSISVCAAWQQVLNAETTDSRDRRLEKFIGVANSKISDLPNWWTAAVRTATVRGSQFTSFRMPASNSANKNEGFSGFGENPSKKQSGQLVIESEPFETRFNIPAPKHVSSIFKLNYLILGDECFFARHSDFCYSYTISCIKAGEHNTKWESEVWASGNLFSLGGPAWHLTELVRRDESLIVFGASPECVYVEVFDIQSGICNCRFSSVLFAGPFEVK